MKKTTERALWIGGAAAAALALVGIGVAVTSKPATASTTPPSGGGGGSAGGTQGGQGGGTGGKQSGGGQVYGPKLAVAGPYTQLGTGVLLGGETYLLEVAPQAGETYATFAQYLAKKGVAPGPVKVVQSFEAASVPTGWPTTNTTSWKYVVQYGGIGPTKNTTPPWSLPAAFAATAWATQGAKG